MHVYAHLDAHGRVHVHVCRYDDNENGLLSYKEFEEVRYIPLDPLQRTALVQGGAAPEAAVHPLTPLNSTSA